MRQSLAIVLDRCLDQASARPWRAVASKVDAHHGAHVSRLRMLCCVCQTLLNDMKDVTGHRQGYLVYVAVRFKQEVGLPTTEAIVIGDQSLKAREQTDVVNFLKPQLLHGTAKPFHNITCNVSKSLSFGNKRRALRRSGNFD